MRGGKILDITGQRFGRLVAIKQVERNSSNKVQWLCQCDCGNTVKVTTGHLRSGHTQSCGCYSRDRAVESNTTHGMKGTRIYNIWCDMRKRCNNKNHWAYYRYGERGIKVCEEWQDFQNFYDWSMSHGYRDDLTIERINNDRDYSPENCKWATRKEQSNNTSRTHYVTVNGETRNILGWAEYLGITRYRIDSAYKRGEDLEEYIGKLIKEIRG